MPETYQSIEKERNALKRKIRRIEHRIKMESTVINPNWLKVRDDIWFILQENEE